MKNIDTRTNRYGDGLESDTIRVTGLTRTRFDLCHIGIVPEGRAGRRVQGGPLVAGPWGYAVTHALVIDNHGGTARERAEAPVTVHVGEPFTVDGMPGLWMMASPRPTHLDGDGPRLVEYDEDHAEAVAYRAEQVGAAMEDAVQQLAAEVTTTRDELAAARRRVTELEREIRALTAARAAAAAERAERETMTGTPA